MGIKIEKTENRPKLNNKAKEQPVRQDKPVKQENPAKQDTLVKQDNLKSEVKASNFKLKVLPQMRKEFLDRMTSFDIVSYVSRVGMIKKCPFTQDDWNLYADILLSEDYDKIEYNSVETLMCVMCLEDFILTKGFQDDNSLYRINYNGTGLVVTGFLNKDTNATPLRVNNGEDSVHTCYYLEFNVKPVGDILIIQPGKLELDPKAEEVAPTFSSLVKDFTFSRLVQGRQVLGWDTCRDGRFSQIDNGTTITALLYRFTEYRNILMLLEELVGYSDALREDITASVKVE